MNVYDTANKLAQEIKESEEIKNYRKYKELVNTNPDIKEKIKKFEALRYEIQLSAMHRSPRNRQ